MTNERAIRQAGIENQGWADEIRMWRPESKALAPLAELWNYLPIYYYIYVLWVSLNGMVRFFPEPRYDYVWAGLFLYGTILISFWARLKLAGADLENGFNAAESPPPMSFKRRVAYFGAFAFALLLFCFAVVFWTPVTIYGEPLEHLDKVKWQHEINSFITIAIVAAHCYWRKGLWGFLVFYFSAFLYGMILESGGVSSGYFFEPCYHLYVPGFSAPAVTMFGWSTVFYPAVLHLEIWRRAYSWAKKANWIKSSAIVALIALTLDLAVDPMASNIGLWMWNELLTPENGSPALFDVPLLNFAAWFWAVFAFGLAYYWVNYLKRKSYAVKKAFYVITLLIPLSLFVSAVGQTATMILIEGIDGPYMQIAKDAARMRPHRYIDKESGEELCAPRWIIEWQNRVDAEKQK